MKAENETDRSRGHREPLGKDLSLPQKQLTRHIRTSTASRELFREAAKKLTNRDAMPEPEQKPRRRSDGDARGGFGMAGVITLRRILRHSHAPIACLPRALWGATAEASTGLNNPVVRESRDPASSAGEIINWFMANGYTIQQIRVMFPGLFADSAPPPQPAFTAMDWLNLWDGNDPTGAFDYGNFHYMEQQHLSLEF